MKKTILLRSFSYIVLFLSTILICIFMDVNCMSAQQQVANTDEIGKAAQMKSEAEDLAAAVKHAYSKKKVSDNNYMRCQHLYIGARAAITGWVTALQAEIEQGRDPAKSEGYRQSLEAAACKAHKFVEYAEATLETTIDKSKKKRAGPLPIADLLNGLTNSGIQIWKELTVKKQKKNENYIKRLDSLKWKSFDSI